MVDTERRNSHVEGSTQDPQKPKEQSSDSPIQRLIIRAQSFHLAERHRRLFTNGRLFDALPGAVCQDISI